jgi:hypothetical protein
MAGKHSHQFWHFDWFKFHLPSFRFLISLIRIHLVSFKDCTHLNENRSA